MHESLNEVNFKIEPWCGVKEKINPLLAYRFVGNEILIVNNDLIHDEIYETESGERLNISSWTKKYECSLVLRLFIQCRRSSFGSRVASIIIHREL